MIIYGKERVAFRFLQESYNFRNGTERLRSGFYKNMIIYRKERGVAEGGVDYNFCNGGTERLRFIPDFTRI